MGRAILVPAVAGSETVKIYRTQNGGSTWKLVSRTGVGDQGSTPGALPFGCDKTVGFTSARVGWAALYCNFGEPSLYASTDGGARWHKLSAVPVPKRAPSPRAGGGISPPTARGSRLAVSLQLDGTTHVATVIATSTNGGRSWHSHLLHGYWSADLLDQRHWRLIDGNTLRSTDDAGLLVPDSRGTPLRWTRDDGATWKPVTIAAGPVTVGG